METAEIQAKLAARARALNKAKQCVSKTLIIDERELHTFSAERVAELQGAEVILMRAEFDCWTKFNALSDS